MNDHMNVTDHVFDPVVCNCCCALCKNSGAAHKYFTTESFHQHTPSRVTFWSRIGLIAEREHQTTPHIDVIVRLPKKP